MKRIRDRQDITTMPNFLILLASSGGGGGGAVAGSGGGLINRVFECKTCKRQFPSFQALGGHRASHKKPRLTNGDEPSPESKRKSHECSICGVEFAVGQALGGHMRRHRISINMQPPSAGTDHSYSNDNGNNYRRVFRLLDLNLTPSQNSFVFGNVSTGAHVDCFF